MPSRSPAYRGCSAKTPTTAKGGSNINWNVKKQKTAEPREEPVKGKKTKTVTAVAMPQEDDGGEDKTLPDLTWPLTEDNFPDVFL